MTVCLCLRVRLPHQRSTLAYPASYALGAGDPETMTAGDTCQALTNNMAVAGCCTFFCLSHTPERPNARTAATGASEGASSLRREPASGATRARCDKTP